MRFPVILAALLTVGGLSAAPHVAETTLTGAAPAAAKAVGTTDVAAQYRGRYGSRGGYGARSYRQRSFGARRGYGWRGGYRYRPRYAYRGWRGGRTVCRYRYGRRICYRGY